MRTYLIGFLTLCFMVFLSGCGGSSASENVESVTEKSVSVERGAVLETIVQDANNQIATYDEQSKKYTFANPIHYPVSASGGYIDVDGSGDRSLGDIPLTFPLITDFGFNITMITTAIAGLGEGEREEMLDRLASSLGTTKEELLKLPSQSYSSSILSNEIFRVFTEEENLALLDILNDIESNHIKEQFIQIIASVEEGVSSGEFALELEQEYVQALIEAGKIEPIAIDPDVQDPDTPVSDDDDSDDNPTTPQDPQTPAPPADTQPPVLQSAQINSDGLTIVLQYSENLHGTVGSDDYEISGATIINALIVNNKVTLTLQAPIIKGSTIEIDYLGTTLFDSSGNRVATSVLSSSNITNNSTQRDPSAITYTPNNGTTEGSSDTSSAIALGEDYMLAIDDEANVARIYPRDGGNATREISYDLHVNSGEELDAEAMTKIGQNLYIIGSHSNKKSGAEDDDREFLLEFTLEGSEADTNLVFSDRYSNLEDDLVAWDNANIHGGGVGHYGLEASAQTVLSPENVDGFSIEGLTSSLDNTMLYLGFRAPLVGTEERAKALIIPVDIDSIMDGDINTNSGATFGTPIELNLGGRGIRSIEKTGDGNEYLILAGPSMASREEVEHNFRLFRWNGLSGASMQLTEIDSDLDVLRHATGGSFETIVEANDAQSGTWVQLLLDNGDTVWDGFTEASKKLDPQDQKFQGFWVRLADDYEDAALSKWAASYPANNDQNIPRNTDIILKFNEGVKSGSGSFVLHKSSDDTIVESALVDSSKVVFDYNQVTITLDTYLDSNTSYYLTYPLGVITDHYNNPIMAQTSQNELRFTTIDSPESQNDTILITEVNSKASEGDFFELYNYGTNAISLQGWKWHDDGATFASATSLGDITLPSGGKLIVYTESTDATDFKSAWNLDDTVSIAAVGGQGLGKNDAVILFNGDGNVVSAMNYGTSSITASDGTVITPALQSDGSTSLGDHAGEAFGGGEKASAIWDGLSTSSPRYTHAQVGTLGAYAQASDSNSIGSPGKISD